MTGPTVWFVVLRNSFVGYSDGKIIISFRGTVLSFKDWINNLKIATTKHFRDECPDCRVHSGFLDTYLSLKVHNATPLMLLALRLKTLASGSSSAQ